MINILFSVKYILKVPNEVLRLYAAVCSVGQQAVDSLAHFYIERKLKAALSHQNLAYIVNLLESNILKVFHKRAPKQTVVSRCYFHNSFSVN